MKAKDKKEDLNLAHLNLQLICILKIVKENYCYKFP